MILLIDNYDSFSYNLYQMIGAINPGVKVIHNDEMSVDEIAQLEISSIVISPGPGRPAQAGVCKEVIRYFAGKLPILGVCLGHQAIGEAFGGDIIYAKKLMHGKQSEVHIDRECPLFHGMGDTIMAARYHSLAIRSETLPAELLITAQTAEGEIMGIMHREYPIYGVQFHPESILTPKGEHMIANFLM